MFADFDFDYAGLIKEIRSRGWEFIAIQAPEGLMRDAVKLSLSFRKEGLHPVVLVNPCYGACDLAKPPSGYDGVIHLGHAPFPGQEDAIFLELPSKADNLKGLESIADTLPERLGLVATVQHLRLLDITKGMLEKHGKEVHVGNPGGRIKHRGQVLGCNTLAARDVKDDVDAYVFIGSGKFHPGGVAMATGKKVYALDPYSGQIEKMDSERFLRIRHAVIEKAKGGKRYGVMVSTKTGQMRRGAAGEVMMELEKNEMEVVLFMGENLPPERFIGLKLDALISTACPRIALDDIANYPFPVITPIEARIMLGLEKWENYSLDELE